MYYSSPSRGVVFDIHIKNNIEDNECLGGLRDAALINIKPVELK